jgi:hypothetical protein
MTVGCWTSSPAPRPLVISPDPPATPIRREPFPRHSVWRGTYVCTQGLTAVTLTIDADENGEAIARYDFGPVPSNPTVPHGSFEMTGRLSAMGQGGFTAAFEPGQWIDQPSGYTMVAITIEARGRKMIGRIHSPNCRDLKVRRVS